MILSASRRTDIPAFYARWLINRIRDGFCVVPNPYNARQAVTVSLAVQDVDAIVFWTRNPRPLFPYLNELDDRGYKYYFQFTLLDYPAAIDPHPPRAGRAVNTFRALANLIGPERVIWRYDPIVLTELTAPDFHCRVYSGLAQLLSGYTRRSVISFMDRYSKAKRRLGQMEAEGARLLFETGDASSGEPPLVLRNLTRDLAEIARGNQMEIVSCAENLDLLPYGVRAGSCIDASLISHLFGIDVASKKDPYQRKACGCAVSKDIGMYESCLFGCRYCYATRSFGQAWVNYRRHDPDSSALY